MPVVVGILSDTHGRLPVMAECALADSDFIIHAGDICDPEILQALRQIAPVYAVLGNNDYPEYGPDVNRFARPVIEGVHFLVAHYPHDVDISGFNTAALAPGDPIPAVCIHGHTHVARITHGAGNSTAQLCLCPGSVTYPRGGNPPTVGRIELEAGRILSAHILDLHGTVII